MILYRQALKWRKPELEEDDLTPILEGYQILLWSGKVVQLEEETHMKTDHLIIHLHL